MDSKYRFSVPLLLSLSASFAVPDVALADDPDISETVVVAAPYDGYVLGVGAMIGDPTALGIKTRFNENNALQLHVGWGFADPYGARATVMLDYLFHFILLPGETNDVGLLSPYVGIGGKVGVRESPDAVAVGVRVPLGLAFMFRDAPIEIFLEVAPGVLVFPEVAALVDGGIGARVYF